MNATVQEERLRGRVDEHFVNDDPSRFSCKRALALTITNVVNEARSRHYNVMTDRIASVAVISNVNYVFRPSVHALTMSCRRHARSLNYSVALNVLIALLGVRRRSNVISFDRDENAARSVLFSAINGVEGKNLMVRARDLEADHGQGAPISDL